MNIWQIAREYAGLAEAGGVKNVVCSLSEGLQKLGHKVTLFIPLYGCTDLSCVSNYTEDKEMSLEVFVGERYYKVFYGFGKLNNVDLVFIISDCYTEKQGVYTYTEAEEKINPSCVRGKGHHDALENEIMFQKAVIDFGKKHFPSPDVVHCHDATAALIPCFAHLTENQNFYAKTNFIVTIHNAGPAYHHEINGYDKAKKLTNLPDEMLQQGLLGHLIEPYLLCSNYCKLTTVSPWYADEITDPNNENTQGLSKALYEKNIKIYGITNGIDFERYNPEYPEKSCLPYQYSPQNGDLEGKYRTRANFFDYFNELSLEDEKKAAIFLQEGLRQNGYLESFNKDTVIFSYHGRLVHQKGLEILEKAIPKCLEQNSNIRFIITGQGDPYLERQQIALANNFRGKVLYLRGYNKALARVCVAISDYIVLPSFFEPCGLEDFIASILGTIPLAHKTGGLQKIIDNSTGFLYAPNTADILKEQILSLIDFKNQNESKFFEMIKQASQEIKNIYDWEKVIINEYIPLYYN